MNQRRLSELEPFWTELAHPAGTCKGLVFNCPACGDHSILVPYEGKSPFPSKAIWKRQGETFENVSFTPSVDCTKEATAEDRCKFHGFITSGLVTW